MYDNPKYASVRDNAFMIFYMGINIGAFFAPFVATGIRNWFLKTQGFLHDGSLPGMCHAYQRGELVNPEAFQALAQNVTISGQPVENLGVFAQQYIDAFSKGYNYAFAIAAGAMVISLLVYIIFNRFLPAKDKISKAEAAEKKIAKMPWAEEKKRLIALGLVFIVVIFFWMSFHQNGLTLTFFARDYTVKTVAPFTNIFFNLDSILSFIAAVAGLFMFVMNKKITQKLIGAGLLLVGGGLTYYFVSGYPASNPIAPEVFQSFNPLFIVALTFPVMGFFAWLNKRNQEPSTPKKIGIGMIIASLGFLIILIASLGLISPHELQFVDAVTGKLDYNPVPDTSRVVPYWLISSYLTLTIAELFLSPMGLSFVSKVAPPRFQGLMQGGWLLATALGNKLLFVGSFFWGKLDLWTLWAIFIVCCLLSAAFIFSIMKRLENATK
jgi:POT family proton-dependent oligopeptide transporter